MVDAVKVRKLILHSNPEVFLESIDYTSAQTGFSRRLIEKDYYCSVILDFLKEYASDQLIFKGGTCLSKVYTDFYRLSEDLDFMVSTPTDAKRKERSEQAAVFKEAVSRLTKTHDFFQIISPLKGQNESKQYIAVISYVSSVTDDREQIKLEIGFREPLLMKKVSGEAKTLLRNIVNPTDNPEPIPFNCLSYPEAMAEKIRAALTRMEVAIRDFYDIYYAVLMKNLNPDATEFLNMVRKKLEIPGNDIPNLSDARLNDLPDQLDTDLRSVLREKDFNAFDLERAIGIVRSVYNQLKGVT